MPDIERAFTDEVTGVISGTEDIRKQRQRIVDIIIFLNKSPLEQVENRNKYNKVFIN